MHLLRLQLLFNKMVGRIAFFLPALKYEIFKPSLENIHRLILGGSSSHKDHLPSVIPDIHNYVHMMCSPSHTFHEIQPLERMFKAT
jgi:hypothetical protein